MNKFLNFLMGPCGVHVGTPRSKCCMLNRKLCLRQILHENILYLPIVEYIYTIENTTNLTS